ncbi:hypothetical protein IL306_014561 [Fusarium sp. DS 682]|nr:hypothetical protein IL306_014561 [Fusarium sp. DS 682]
MSSQDAVAIQRPMRGVRRKRNEYTLIAWYPIVALFASPERSNVMASGRVNAAQSEAKSVAIHAVATYQVSTQWSRKYLYTRDALQRLKK